MKSRCDPCSIYHIRVPWHFREIRVIIIFVTKLCQRIIKIQFCVPIVVANINTERLSEKQVSEREQRSPIGIYIYIYIYGAQKIV